MLNIIKSDFYKLIKSKAFWICVIICVGYAILSVGAYQGVISSAVADPNHSEHANMVKMASEVSGAWSLEYFAAMGFQFLIIGIFIATFLAPEFSYGTMKNGLSRGANRIKVFLSKFLVSSCASVFMILLYIPVLLLAGTVVWGFDPNGIFSLSGFMSILSTQMLLAIAFAALFTFISMSIRSYGGAMATSIMCIIMGGKLFSSIGSITGLTTLDKFWLEWGYSNMSKFDPVSGDLMFGIFVALGWMIVSIVVGSILFKKMDVK